MIDKNTRPWVLDECMHFRMSGNGPVRGPTANDMLVRMLRVRHASVHENIQGDALPGTLRACWERLSSVRGERLETRHVLSPAI